MTRIVVVTGPDGGGKSTAIAAARAALGQDRSREVSIWDGMGPFVSRRDAMAYLLDNDAPSRLLLLFHAMSRALTLARRSGAELLVVDGYWYKYAVSELGQGVPLDVVLGAARGFPRPERTLCIDIDPATAAARKVEPSAYEQGGSSFVRFQESLRPWWRALEAKVGPWTHLDGAAPREDVAAAVLRELGP